MQQQLLTDKIFNIKDDKDFNAAALQVFHFQYEQNIVYNQWCKALGRDPASVGKLEDIPFLPVSFFKTHKVKSFQGSPKLEFTSSGTTASEPSRHYVLHPEIYQRSFTEGFRLFYGDPSQYCILALLPGYLERTGSSLVYMADHLIRQSNNPSSGFYLNRLDELNEMLIKLVRGKQKILLIGVSFALLDLAGKYPMPLENTIIMETGGMKGRRREMIREELHEILKDAFSLKNIHSEYGMTELLSQAYSRAEGLFYCPPWMRILLRDSYDPLSLGRGSRSGGINIIDLANINSCSFIATEDLGKYHPDGGFEVLGRFDNSDIRGCNLMVL